MPADGVQWLARDDILRFEEICDVVRAAIEIHGIRRFKLTGGEPTVRRGLVDLVAMLRRIPGIEDLSLTTNGQRLSELAYPLREAGLDRVTISLDSLQPEKFRRITRTGDLHQVLLGLERCEEAGFGGLKINCVTMRGTNDDEVADFARLSLNRPLTVRFIEYMPLGDAALSAARAVSCHRRVCRRSANDSAGMAVHPCHCAMISDDENRPRRRVARAGSRAAESLIPEAQVRELIEDELGPLLPIDRSDEPGVGPANVYRLALGNPRGRIGFISAMSAPFCATCNRLRLTANGVLRSCLFEGGEVDIRSTLRSATSPSARGHAVAKAMVDCVRQKPEVHSRHGNEQMSRIGG